MQNYIKPNLYQGEKNGRPSNKTSIHTQEKKAFGHEEKEARQNVRSQEEVRKTDKDNLMILVDTSLDVEARLRKARMSKADVMELFNDPDIQVEWLEMCRGQILMLHIPDLLDTLRSDAISGSERIRTGAQKLFLQAINALKVEDHKHLHLNGYSDDRLGSEIDRVMENVKELQGTSFPVRGGGDGE